MDDWPSCGDAEIDEAFKSCTDAVTNELNKIPASKFWERERESFYKPSGLGTAMLSIHMAYATTNIQGSTYGTLFDRTNPSLTRVILKLGLRHKTAFIYDRSHVRMNTRNCATRSTPMDLEYLQMRRLSSTEIWRRNWKTLGELR